MAWNSPSLHMLEARTDLAALWDIRVRCEYRRLGVGSRLIDRCAEWARRKGCNRLKIETQDTNVALRPPEKAYLRATDPSPRMGGGCPIRSKGSREAASSSNSTPMPGESGGI